MKNRARLYDLIKQTPVMAGALAIIALISYLLTMLVESCIIRLGLNLMASEKTIVVTMAVLSLISFVFCFFALKYYMRKIGKSDYGFCKNEGIEKPEINRKYAVIAISISVLMYGIVLLLLNFFHWNFFEGPIFYISFVFYSIPETVYPETTASYVYVWCELVGYLIYSVGFISAMLLGYCDGFLDAEGKNAEE